MGPAPAFLTLNGATALPPDLAGAADFESSLAAALAADPALSGLVAGRVFPVAVPQAGALPALAYQVLSKAREQDLDGPTGVARARVALRALAGDLGTCRAVVDACRNRLDGLAGPLAAVVVLEAQCDDENDDYDEPADGSDAGTFELPLTVTARFYEPKPIR